MPRGPRQAVRCLAPNMVLMAALGCGAEDVPRPNGTVSTGPIALPPGQTVGGPARPLGKADGPRFSGVAAVGIGSHACAGSFVVSSTLDPAVDGPAYVLTAGHCIVDLAWEANTVLREAAFDSQPNAVTFRQFADSPDYAVTVGAERIAYATMKGIDIGVIELAATRHQLRQQGIVPFVLADEPPALDAEIVLAGTIGAIPSIVACRLGWRVPMLLEGKYHWYDVDADDCLDIAPGSSGSGLFALATGRLFGVLSTQTSPQYQEWPCALNEPCEAGNAGTRLMLNVNYSAPATGLAACFDEVGRFVLDRPLCPLDRDRQMQPVAAEHAQPAVPGTTLSVQMPLHARGLTHYRYRLSPVGSDDCRGTDRYGPVVAWADAPAIGATIPGDVARFLMCIQAGPGADPAGAGWQDPAMPTVAVVEIH